MPPSGHGASIRPRSTGRCEGAPPIRRDPGCRRTRRRRAGRRRRPTPSRRPSAGSGPGAPRRRRRGPRRSRSRSPAWRVRPRRSGRTGSRGCPSGTASLTARGAGLRRRTPRRPHLPMPGRPRRGGSRRGSRMPRGRCRGSRPGSSRPAGGVGPLGLQVLGRRHDDHTSRLALNRLTGCREREGGLARARCGDGEEVRGGPLGEAVEGISLPASESKRSGHVNGPR